MIQAQLLPAGYPTTTVYAYGGLVNFNPTGLPADDNIQTASTIPGPTFEAVRDQRFFVHYSNQLDGDLIFPNDPTIMGANVNNASIRTAPFKPLPPGYKDFQNPIPTVAHLHGGVTAGPGYVWHCHILDHEDNDMMRPMKMVAVSSASVASKGRTRGTKVTRVVTPAPVAKPPHTGMGTMQMQKLTPQ